MRKQFIEQGKKLGLVGSALAVFVTEAMAAVPAGVTEAITSAGADAATVAGALLIAAVGLLAFHWMRREAK